MGLLDLGRESGLLELGLLDLGRESELLGRLDLNDDPPPGRAEVESCRHRSALSPKHTETRTLNRR